MKTIEVLDMIDMPDGSALMNMDVEPEQVKAFAHTGLSYIIEQLGLREGTVSPNTFDDRTIELTNEELNVLFHFGVISALKRGIDEQNQEEEENRG